LSPFFYSGIVSIVNRNIIEKNSGKNSKILLIIDITKLFFVLYNSNINQGVKRETSVIQKISITKLEREGLFPTPKDVNKVQDKIPNSGYI
jgi:predicted GIY-YIG superfamily endonuclease